MRHARFPALLILLFTLGCGSAPQPGRGAGTHVVVTASDIADVVYRLGTSDEGLLTLLNAPVDADPAAVPAVTAPANHAVVSGPTEVVFGVGSTATLRPRRTGPSHGKVPFEPWSFLEGTAYAHGPIMNGEAFFLAFETRDGEPLLRVFLQERSYVPSGSEWRLLAAAPGPASIRLWRAVFEQGRLTEDGGPFAAVPLEVTLAD
jgi:hypothetical protein